MSQLKETTTPMERIVMNQQTSEGQSNQQPLTEDLTLNESREEAVKGGAGVKTIRFKPGKDPQT